MIFQMTVRGNHWTNLGIEKLSMVESKELKWAISSLIGVWRNMILLEWTGTEWDTVSGEAGFPVSMEGKRMDGCVWVWVNNGYFRLITSSHPAICKLEMLHRNAHLPQLSNWVWKKEGIISFLDHCNVDHNIIKRGVWFALQAMRDWTVMQKESESQWWSRLVVRAALKGERSTLSGDAINQKNISIPICCVYLALNVSLKGLVQLGNLQGKTISCYSIVETLWGQKIETLLLIMLQNVKWLVGTYSPWVKLGQKLVRSCPWTPHWVAIWLWGINGWAVLYWLRHRLSHANGRDVRKLESMTPHLFFSWVVRPHLCIVRRVAWFRKWKWGMVEFMISKFTRWRMAVKALSERALTHHFSHPSGPGEERGFHGRGVSVTQQEPSVRAIGMGKQWHGHGPLEQRESLAKVSQ